MKDGISPQDLIADPSYLESPVEPFRLFTVLDIFISRFYNSEVIAQEAPFEFYLVNLTEEETSEPSARELKTAKNIMVVDLGFMALQTASFSRSPVFADNSYFLLSSLKRNGLLNSVLSDIEKNLQEYLKSPLSYASSLILFSLGLDFQPLLKDGEKGLLKAWLELEKDEDWKPYLPADKSIRNINSLEALAALPAVHTLHLSLKVQLFIIKSYLNSFYPEIMPGTVFTIRSSAEDRPDEDHVLTQKQAALLRRISKLEINFECAF